MNTYVCKYCGKMFKTETGYLKHNCKQKKRYDNFNWLAYMIYNMFCRHFHYKVYNDEEYGKICFVKSKYYDIFNEFSIWLNDMNVINVTEYVKYLLTYEIELKQWENEKTLRCFLYNYLRTEPLSTAIIRSEKYLKEHNCSLETISEGLLLLALRNGFINNRFLKEKNYDWKDKLKDILNNNEFNQLKYFLED